MLFYLQSSISDKDVRLAEYPTERTDVVLGSVLSDLIAAFIICTAATLLQPGSRSTPPTTPRGRWRMRPSGAATRRCMCARHACWRNWPSAVAMGGTCVGWPNWPGSACSSWMSSWRTPPNLVEAKELLEVIDDRRQVRSTLVVSHVPVEAWHPALAGGDPTLADAILDRLVHNAHRLALTGRSMRRRQPEDPAP
jgi:hypothetical protein